MTVKKDNAARDLINEKKKDFYTSYAYLKPECEIVLFDSLKNAVKPVSDWLKDHWKQMVIGVSFIVIGAALTALTGGAFGAVLLAGLKSALVSGLISGGICAAFSIGGSLFKREDIKMLDVAKSFGDGFASGFMFGGIIAGSSMIISAGFKTAVKLGASTGRKAGIGKEGIAKILSPDRLASDGNGGGTIIKIGKTLRLDVDTRILTGGKHLNPLKMANFMHMHIPGLTSNIPKLFIVGGHIPIGLYISAICGATHEIRQEKKDNND